MNFYADKSDDLPRLLYRRARRELVERPDGNAVRSAVINLCNELTMFKGDYRKLRFYLPSFLVEVLTDDERELVDGVLSKMRTKLENRLSNVYPHCSDEFSLATPFLMDVLCESPVGGISKSHKSFTIGSCFARNIAEHLNAKGYNFSVLGQTEDLNSPFSNAELLELCTTQPLVRRTLIAKWLDTFSPQEAQQNQTQAENMSEAIETIKHTIAHVDIIVLTLGNNLDFFGDVPNQIKEISSDREYSYEIAPKVLGFVDTEDVGRRATFAKQLTKRGFQLRAGTFTETKSAVLTLLRRLRQLNSHCKFYITLSPVPIDSAIGLNSDQMQGAVKLDCQSKSQLRCIIDELQNEGVADFVYFPSFEVVRWLAPMVSAPIFGQEDAASRHVSSQILESVFNLFEACHCDG